MTRMRQATSWFFLLQWLGFGLCISFPLPLQAATTETAPPVETKAVESSSTAAGTEASIATPNPLPEPVVVESVPQATAATSLKAAEAEPVVIAPSASEETTPAGSVFSIDPQDYQLKATDDSAAPAVVLSERSSGCQAVVQPGETAPSSLCKSPPAKTVYLSQGSGATLPQGWSGSDRAQKTSIGDGVSGPGQRSSWRGERQRTTSISTLYRGVNPLQWLELNGKNMLYPLAIPVPITSAFGWRLHPISGSWRLHSGTDLGAPIGTPVLAVQDGQVLTADYLGGYGNSVILSHNQHQQETLYAHLSEMLVTPGQTVKQGEVIGLVGSTGNSTGPHLHFELLQRTVEGMVPVDAGPKLTLALGQLQRAIQIAQVQPQKKRFLASKQ